MQHRRHQSWKRAKGGPRERQVVWVPRNPQAQEAVQDASSKDVAQPSQSVPNSNANYGQTKAPSNSTQIYPKSQPTSTPDKTTSTSPVSAPPQQNSQTPKAPGKVASTPPNPTQSSNAAQRKSNPYKSQPHSNSSPLQHNPTQSDSSTPAPLSPIQKAAASKPGEIVDKSGNSKASPPPKASPAMSPGLDRGPYGRPSTHNPRTFSRPDTRNHPSKGQPNSLTDVQQQEYRPHPRAHPRAHPRSHPRPHMRANYRGEPRPVDPIPSQTPESRTTYDSPPKDSASTPLSPKNASQQKGHANSIESPPPKPDEKSSRSKKSSPAQGAERSDSVSSPISESGTAGTPNGTKSAQGSKPAADTSVAADTKDADAANPPKKKRERMLSGNAAPWHPPAAKATAPPEPVVPQSAEAENARVGQDMAPYEPHYDRHNNHHSSHYHQDWTPTGDELVLYHNQPQEPLPNVVYCPFPDEYPGWAPLQPYHLTTGQFMCPSVRAYPCLDPPGPCSPYCDVCGAHHSFHAAVLRSIEAKKAQTEHAHPRSFILPKNRPKPSQGAAPTHGHSFTVVTYNILLPLRATEFMYPYSEKAILDTWYRWCNISQEIVHYSADFVCLQEVDKPYLTYLEQYCILSHTNTRYTAFYQQRQNNPDGCAILYKQNKYELINDVTIRLRHPYKPSCDTDNVAIAAIFRSKKKEDELICVATVHLFWNPYYPEIKYDQTQHVLQSLYGFLEHHNLTDIPLVLAGDLNSTPTSPVYKLIKNDTSLGLQSIYAELSEEDKNCPTNYTPHFVDCIDYVFFSKKHLHPMAILSEPTPSDLYDNVALPNRFYSSDHVAVGGGFMIKPT